MRTKYILPCIITIFTIATFASAKASSSMPVSLPTAPPLTAKAYMLVDYNSNQTLAAKNVDQQIEPASLTKMMTMYVIDNEIKSGNLNLNDLVTVSHKAWQAPGSRMFINVGKKISVKNLIKGIIIQSGNDASIALAEHIAGSETAFAELMNTYAQMLGMSNTHFSNSTGLPSKKHYTSARDIVTLAKAIINDFPETYKIYSEKEFTYNGIRQTNRNLLLWRNEFVDGIKTGRTETAGHCLAASAKRGNMRLIAIIIGTKNDSIRTIEANKLLTWGFRFFKTHHLYKAGTSLKNIPIWMGNKEQLDIGLNNDLYITVPYNQYDKLNIALNMPTFIKAPITKGIQIGTYKVQLYEQTLTEQQLISLETIEKGSLWSRVKDHISLGLQSLLDKFNI